MDIKKINGFLLKYFIETYWNTNSVSNAISGLRLNRVSMISPPIEDIEYEKNGVIAHSKGIRLNGQPIEFKYTAYLDRHVFYSIPIDRLGPIQINMQSNTFTLLTQAYRSNTKFILYSNKGKLIDTNDVHIALVGSTGNSSTNEVLLSIPLETLKKYGGYETELYATIFTGEDIYPDSYIAGEVLHVLIENSISIGDCAPIFANGNLIYYKKVSQIDTSLTYTTRLSKYYTDYKKIDTLPVVIVNDKKYYLFHIAKNKNPDNKILRKHNTEFFLSTSTTENGARSGYNIDRLFEKDIIQLTHNDFLIDKYKLDELREPSKINYLCVGYADTNLATLQDNVNDLLYLYELTDEEIINSLSKKSVIFENCTYDKLLQSNFFIEIIKTFPDINSINHTNIMNILGYDRVLELITTRFFNAIGDTIDIKLSFFYNTASVEFIVTLDGLLLNESEYNLTIHNSQEVTIEIPTAEEDSEIVVEVLKKVQNSTTIVFPNINTLYPDERRKVKMLHNDFVLAKQVKEVNIASGPVPSLKNVTYEYEKYVDIVTDNGVSWIAFKKEYDSNLFVVSFGQGFDKDIITLDTETDFIPLYTPIQHTVSGRGIDIIDLSSSEYIGLDIGEVNIVPYTESNGVRTYDYANKRDARVLLQRKHPNTDEMVGMNIGANEVLIIEPSELVYGNSTEPYLVEIDYKDNSFINFTNPQVFRLLSHNYENKIITYDNTAEYYSSAITPRYRAFMIDGVTVNGNTYLLDNNFSLDNTLSIPISLDDFVDGKLIIDPMVQSGEIKRIAKVKLSFKSKHRNYLYLQDTKVSINWGNIQDYIVFANRKLLIPKIDYIEQGPEDQLHITHGIRILNDEYKAVDTQFVIYRTRGIELGHYIEKMVNGFVSQPLNKTIHITKSLQNTVDLDVINLSMWLKIYPDKFNYLPLTIDAYAYQIAFLNNGENMRLINNTSQLEVYYNYHNVFTELRVDFTNTLNIPGISNKIPFSSLDIDGYETINYYAFHKFYTGFRIVAYDEENNAVGSFTIHKNTDGTFPKQRYYLSDFKIPNADLYHSPTHDPMPPQDIYTVGIILMKSKNSVVDQFPKFRFNQDKGYVNVIQRALGRDAGYLNYSANHYVYPTSLPSFNYSIDTERKELPYSTRRCVNNKMVSTIRRSDDGNTYNSHQEVATPPDYSIEEKIILPADQFSFITKLYLANGAKLPTKYLS